MEWVAYYNYSILGDVLMLLYEVEKKPFCYERNGNVVAIYDENHTLIGVNLFSFSEIVKMKTKGRIPFFPHPVFTIINNTLKNAHLPLLEELDHSGFVIGRVIQKNGDHLLVSLKNETLEVEDKEAKENDLVVVAFKGSVSFDGKVFSTPTLVRENEIGISFSPILVTLEKEEEGTDYFIRPKQK